MTRSDPPDFGWVHVVASVFVGGALVIVGLYLAYRVQSARDMIRELDAHLARQDAAMDAIVRDQERILQALEAKR